MRVLRTALRPYPPDFPCFNQGSYGMELDMGLIRTESDVLTFSQRRSYTNLPTIINTTVTILARQLYDFTFWLNNNVGLWVDLPLAHPFMPNGVKEENVPARILDFTLAEDYGDWGTVTGIVTIQLSPTVFIDNANDTDPFDWIIAGRVPEPSPDWTIARRVTNPATDWVIAGRAPDPGQP